MAKRCASCGKTLSFRDSYIRATRFCKTCERMQPVVPKNVILAVVLALFFGWLGMIYVGRGIASFCIYIVAILCSAVLAGSQIPELTYIPIFLYAISQAIWAGLRARATRKTV